MYTFFGRICVVPFKFLAGFYTTLAQGDGRAPSRKQALRGWKSGGEIPGAATAEAEGAEVRVLELECFAEDLRSPLELLRGAFHS